MCAQPGVAVTIYDAFGICRFMNPQAKQFYLEDITINPVGKSIEELEGPDIARERTGLITQVINTGQAVTLRQICGGQSTEATLWDTGESDEGTPLILMMTRYVTSVDRKRPRAFPVVESEFVELGDLNCLSEKELIVLTLIGKGWPLKRIASRLDTPIRTIENRRSSIGKKLSADSLVALAKIAHDAGLEDRHSKLRRIVRQRPRALHSGGPAISSPMNRHTRPGTHSIPKTRERV